MGRLMQMMIRSAAMVSAAMLLPDTAKALMPRAEKAVQLRKAGAPRGHRVVNRLNRSQHWRHAKSYQQARALSPWPDRPVR